jgi:ABC-type transport system involved in cytochrome c biogenesis permease subunit
MHPLLHSVARRAWRVSTSLGTSCVLLLLLGLLTWLGTLAQVELGLHETQRKYFESYVLLQPVGPLSIPLPGANLVLSALFVNLVAGGLLRLRRGLATLGVLIAHVGVALLLVGSFVKLHGSVDGQVTLYEGQHADWFQSEQRWELVVRERSGTERAREHVLPEERFADACDERTLRIRTVDLPFELAVSRFARNSRLVAGLVGDEAPRLVEEPAQREPGANHAGVCVVANHAADAAPSTGVLWGGARAPWLLHSAGRVFELELRRERYALPFTLELAHFEKQDHPGLDLPKSFASDVKLTTPTGERLLRISMNEPLREGGVVVYQASWGPQGAGPEARLYSTFAVARNPSDRVPLVACLIVAAGLLLHFTRKLVVHLCSPAHVQRSTRLRLSLLPRVAAGFALLCVALQFAAPARAQVAPSWTERTLELAASLPLQEGGRVKPLSTHASTTLLRLSGRRALTTSDGARLDGTAWLLELLCFPNRSAQRAVFLVQNPEVLDAIGVAHIDRRARDRYSFDELRPGLEQLLSLAHEYAAIDERERGAVQAQVVHLAENALVYGRWAGALDCARLDEPRFEDFVADAAATHALRETYLHAATDSKLLAIFAPLVSAEASPAWLSPHEIALRACSGSAPAEEHVEALRRLGRFARSADDPVAAEREFAALHALCTRLAAARGEGRRLGLEVAYYRWAPLHWSLCAFGIGFVLLAGTWLWPRSRGLYAATAASAFVGTLLVLLAITLRCVIRGRPPVSTLYETVLFVTATGALGALVVAWLARQRVALGAGVVLGVSGLFVANGYEALDARDTMPSLVAVLDTNFWLATHVTAITIGYAAGLYAALLGSLYALGKFVGYRRGDAEHYRGIASMVYGVLCFGVIFTTVGTLLGGIWANESWGRFWGWDPKENGALLIVISQLAILHARKGGYLRESGLCLAAAFGGSVVAFSWWGVNLLGVGLHSYGFTSGIQRALWSYYALQCGVVLCGLFACWRERDSRSQLALTEEASGKHRRRAQGGARP